MATSMAPLSKAQLRDLLKSYATICHLKDELDYCERQRKKTAKRLTASEKKRSKLECELEDLESDNEGLETAKR